MKRLFWGLVFVTSAASAQTYPPRPITFVVPYTPGTGILALPDVRETFTKQGMIPAHSSPEDLHRQIAVDVQRWKKFIAETGIKAD